MPPGLEDNHPQPYIPSIPEILRETNCGTLKEWAGNIASEISTLGLDLQLVKKWSRKWFEIKIKRMYLRRKFRHVRSRYVSIECGPVSDLPKEPPV